jgi:hypothetical protein
MNPAADLIPSIRVFFAHASRGIKHTRREIHACMTGTAFPVAFAGEAQGTALLAMENLKLLDQGRRLLLGLDDRMYAAQAPGIGGQRIGAQMRHVLEFYECLIAGVTRGFVDYDARVRDSAVESDRRVALDRIEKIRRALGRLSGFGDAALQVRMEDAPDDSLEYVFRSSIGRELQVLRSHTVHHYALIAVLVLAWGLELESDFGVAPSTLRYRSLKGSKATGA